MVVTGVLVTFDIWQDKVPASCLAGAKPCTRQGSRLLIWFLVMGSERSAALYQPGNRAGLRGASSAHQGQLWVGGAHVSGRLSPDPKKPCSPFGSRAAGWV